MKMHPSAIWRSWPERLPSRLHQAVSEGLSECRQPTAALFFRADDIGVPGKNFERLMGLFARTRTPLALAVVPAWLTPDRWRALRTLGRGAEDLWCWHQHGWSHASHAVSGKKHEFGGDREPRRIEDDLDRGWTRLRRLMGDAFFPGFTPPWNRCGKAALDAMIEKGFRFVSRSAGADPAAPAGLADIPVNVDLHTRKEAHPAAGWNHLLSEIQRGIASGRCGVMIHHQRMNGAAFAFLEMLIAAAAASGRLERVHLGRLANS